MTGINKNFKSRGFTIVELVVVMAVFLFVIGGAVVIFISIVQHQRRVLNEQGVLNQISYVEEYMSKALRMAKAQIGEVCLTDAEDEPLGGYVYLLTRPDGAGLYRGIKFINQSNNDQCQEFYFEEGVLKELKPNPFGDEILNLTSSDVQITSIRFAIDGIDGTKDSFDAIYPGCADRGSCGATWKESDIQPRITILIKAKSGLTRDGSELLIQTTVSQRNIE